jgi:anti-sigma regulatory factor (Ser/Thr protein kinase)
VGELIKHFKPVAKLDQESRPALYEALIECMNNVLEHAYPEKQGAPGELQHWWLLGYRDFAKSEVSFCFYDQGLGIPNTIRTRIKDAPWLPFFSRSGSVLIEEAVVRGRYSRTQKPSKGRGLPTLKRFIDVASDGELAILSDRSRCIFHTGKKPERNEFSIGLPGTLITWNIRNLRDENTQN